jgi:hypothetical protein
MHRLLCLLLLLATAWPPVTALASVDFPSAAGQMLILHYEELAGIEFRQEAVGAVSAAQFRKNRQPGAIRFRAYGRLFDLRLVENDSLLIDPRRSESAPGDAEQIAYRLLKGRLGDAPTSWARLTLADGYVAGVIWDGYELYAVDTAAAVREALANPHSGDATQVIYRLADTYIAPGALACGIDTGTAGARSAAAAYRKLVSELRQNAPAATLSATRQLDLSALGDTDFVADFGGGSEAALMARFNVVEGIYSEQVGVRIRVDTVQFEQPGDGTFNTNDPSLLLEQLADLRAATPTLRATGLSHLYTGRNLADDVIGIAYLETVCETRFGAGLSQAGRTVTSDALVAAHEIGHNFGAVHDGDPPCEQAGGSFLMAPTQNGSDQFSQCSLETIQAVAAAAGCLATIAEVDVGLSVSPVQAEPLLTRNVDVTFSATNSGRGNADGLLLDISLPSALRIVEVTPSSGSCTTAAGGLRCEPGTLGPDGSSTVSLVLGADQTGSFAVEGSLQAPGDASVGDNSASATITVRPAVDLEVRFVGGPVSLQRSSSAEATVTVTNSDAGVATDLQMTVTAPVGLDIAGVRTDRGTCEASVRQLGCTLTLLPADEQFSVTLTLTARQAGSYELQAQANAAESDLDTANDAASLAVNVTEAVSAGGGGGGGALGSELLALALLSIVGRRNVRRKAARPSAAVRHGADSFGAGSR